MNQERQKIWFVTGSQDLYGQAALDVVDRQSRTVVQGLNDSGGLPLPVEFKGVLIDSPSILATIREAAADPACVGLIAWMHTFSPAKIWIRGLRELSVPLLHLHTQHRDRIPVDTIDMDFMNINQTAHGGREFGHVATRLGVRRKVVVGHWSDERVLREVSAWMRAALGRAEFEGMKIARFGDSMRNVAVTDGDRVSAEETLGLTVHGYGIGDLVERMGEASESDVTALVERYQTEYRTAEALGKGGTHHSALLHAARQEIALRSFLDDGGYTAFCDSFQMLHGLEQLPGLAVQRLMADGYGFAAEGDWKTAALLRAMKVMSAGLEGGTSFMEDYTYDFYGEESRVLGAHMLEICPSIATDGKPSLEIHPLDIGGKDDPVRLVFDVPSGPAINVALMDMGSRFRLLVNDVVVETPEKPFPKLPVARALWKPLPDLATAAAAWIYAGGSHHTVFSMALTAEHMEDLAEIFDLEVYFIDKDTTLRRFRQDLRR